MKKTSLLLVAAYKGLRTTYAAALSGAFHVIARDSLPAVDDFVLRRAHLIFIVNQAAPVPEYLINDLAETVRIPVVVLVDAGSTSLEHYEQRNRYLHTLHSPVSNDQLITALTKIVTDVRSPRTEEQEEQERAADAAFKKIYQSSGFRRKIDKTLDYLHEHYAVATSMHALARMFDLNYASMRQAIERKTGMPPLEYLREIRLEKMLQLIQFTRLSAEEICMETGLKDLKYARELFHRRFGLTIEECIAQFRVKQ